MKRILKYVALALLAVVFVCTIWFLYQKSQAKPQEFTLDSPAKMTIVKKTVATGKVIPRREIEVKSQVSGVVEKLYVTAGQVVKKGATLARIQLRPNMISVSQAEAQVQSAKTNLRNQAADLVRYKSLLQQKLISELEFNKHQTEFSLQEEAVAAAENTLLLLKTGQSRNASNVSNMIPATIDGTVLDVPNKEGAFILETSTFQAGTTLATLADMNDMIFEGLVDEAEVGKLKQGMELVINVGALQGKPFKAMLEYIAPKGVTDQGTIKFTIRAAVQLDESLFLRSNYSANADIVLDKREDVLAINEGNLVIEDKKTFVEVQTAPQQFEKREIKTGLSDGINVEVVSGLGPEDKIKHR